MSKHQSGEKKYFFDNPQNVKRFIRIFYAVCIALLVMDFFVPKHGSQYWENVPQFYAAYGLVACVILVLVSKFVLRPLVKRKEDYYD